MKPEQLEALLRYRMEQAHDTLREAEILLNAAALRGAINRAYYAMFYALLALLATKQLGTSKHSGAISLFDREFVKTGVFPRELSRSLHLAFDRRQTHDYGEMVEIDQQIAEETLAEAKSFVAAIESHLRSIGHLTTIQGETEDK
ncbi:MAG: HEPN domain-containing protein [Chloroflexota bacterium]|nr:MAG: HEPN domain-containing protein [Chloroflexota bacterium]